MAEAILPPGFLFGVSDSGYQSEGGYNGPGQPANNWAAWDRSGRVEPAGMANQFWERHPEHFERAVAAGCDAYRLGVEWTRCVPTPATVDHAAIEGYVEILRSARAHGVEPVVALHHFTHPEWLGPDFWLRDDSPQRFVEWVSLIVPHLAPHCRRWTTVNEINALAIGSQLIGYFPPGNRLRPSRMMRAVDNLLTAHVLAYEEIHRHQDDALVGTSTYAFWPYDVDRVLVDVLAARAHGARRPQVSEWLGGRRRAFHQQVLAWCPPAYRAYQHGIARGMRTLLAPERRLPRTLEAVYASPHERCLDVNQVNYYDPNLANYLCAPGRRTARGTRHWGPDPEHWEQKPGPEHFATYLAASVVEGTETWILENGLCSPDFPASAPMRPDGYDRPRYLGEHLRAVVDAVDHGVPVTGYFTWGLFDNYQWGEYESCFGLYAVKRGEECKYLDHDSMGIDSAGAYRRLADGLRAGDRSVLP